jgi:uncharacterized protein YidB (DUF937 family)
MGLLDSVIGAALGQGGGNNSQAALINAVLSMLQGGGANAPAASGGGGLGGLGGMLGSVLGGAGASAGGGGGGGLAGGGLGGLLDQFTRGGLGDVAKSWVGTGQNLPVSPDQISQVFGKDALGSLASQLGMGHTEVAGQLSQILPGLVDKLTPQGQIPQGDVHGLGADQIIGMLGGLLGKR